MAELLVSIREKSFPTPGGGPRLVIQDLAFAQRSGEFLAVVGPSGCGKTTLLNIIAGLETDFSGDVVMRGTTAAEPRIGYVFQSPRLLPWRTVHQNIAVTLPHSVDPAIIDALLQEVGLAEARDQYPAQLSLGMGRRAAIARALAVKPDLLLMDEPFVSLDEATADHLRALLLRLWRSHPTSVLLVTHDLREAVMLADRILLLSSGPARLLADIAVPIPRERRDDARAIEAVRADILRRQFAAPLAGEGARAAGR